MLGIREIQVSCLPVSQSQSLCLPLALWRPASERPRNDGHFLSNCHLLSSYCLEPFAEALSSPHLYQPSEVLMYLLYSPGDLTQLA